MRLNIKFTVIEFSPRMNKAEKFWNKKAQTFDQSDNPESEVRKKKYGKIRKYLNKDQVLLDYGCATGSLSI